MTCSFFVSKTVRVGWRPAVVGDDEKAAVRRRRHVERQIADLDVLSGRRDPPAVGQERRAADWRPGSRRGHGAALGNRSDDGNDAGAERQQDRGAAAGGLAVSLEVIARGLYGTGHLCDPASRPGLSYPMVESAR